MALKDLHLKLIKAIRVRKFLTSRNSQSSKYENTKKQSWSRSISHGFYISEDHRSLMYGPDKSSESDSIVVQKEQIQDLEVWLFGISDAQTGDGVTKYLQSHLFDKKLNQNQIKRRSKETMKKAYLSSKAKLLDQGTQAANDQTWTSGGSTSVIVIDGQKIVAANMGDYKTVVCKDGMAHQICERNHPTATRRRWSLNIISGALYRGFRNIGGGDKPSTKRSEPDIDVEKVDYDTEFLILASSGIWEVMKNQEAVSLIRHIDDPQEAAECLAKEALTRFSKSNISCLVIRFD
ncbi:Protein phosphatase 2C (PP2C)-like domain [Macleaya cordata]|uniref:Protein phosphatase 2C (PP2C)-like domain n=1 Tax=Macleaya cordata TaxID=56857 RepID=A0A200PVZ8_MACCD|nr:Protein phosphatase 2C (PP2C)-like domain [Macleaya cordata]